MADPAAARSMSRSAIPARTARAPTCFGFTARASRASFLGGVEVERLLELHAREHHARVGAMRGELQRLGQHLLGVPRIVLVEVQVGAPEERLRARAPVKRPARRRDLGSLTLVIGGVRVLRMPQQVHRASLHRQPLGVGRRDRVAPVFVGELEQDRLGVGPSPATDQQLAELQADPAASRARAPGGRRQETDGLVHLAARGEDLGVHRERDEANVRAAALRRDRRALGSSTTFPLFEQDPRERRLRRRTVGPWIAPERLLCAAG